MNRFNFVVVAALLSAAGPALATPGSNFAPTTISKGNFGALDVKAEKVDHWDLFVRSKDDTDVAVDKLTVQPGGYSGWHAHPAPIFVTVLSGTIEWTDGLLCSPKIYVAGQSFIEPAFRTHMVRNTAGTVAEFTAIRLAPTGKAVRIDQPEPNNCNF